MSERDKNPVAAVCGDEAMIYGDANSRGVRPLRKIVRFDNYGQAREYAREFDDKQKEKSKKSFH